jgi:competence protein ComEC
LLALAFVAGAYCGSDLGARWSAASASALLLAALLLSLRARAEAAPLEEEGPSWPALLSAMAVAAALGLLRSSAAPLPVTDPALEAWLDDGAAAHGGREPLLVEATVESSDLGPAGSRLVVRLTARETRPLSPLEPAPEGPRAALAGPPGVHTGDRLRGLVHLHRPEPARNPGQDDQRARLARRGLAYAGTLDAQDLLVLSRGGPLDGVLDRLRARFSARCRDLCTTPQRAALVAALGAGDRSGLDPATDDSLAASGLVHLLASAGLHLAAAAWLGRALCLRLLQRLRLRRADALAALAGLACAGVQAALLGGPWPALRAAAAAAIFLCGPLLERRADGLTLLATSAAACALWDPSALHEPALQLSLLGVAGLLVAAPRLRELWPVRGPPDATLRTKPAAFLREEVTRLFFASLAATLCCAPLLAATFHRVSAVAPLANAVALGPGLAALPLASLLVVLDAALPAVTLPLFWLCDGLAGLVLALSSAFASLPFAVVRPAAPTLLQGLLWGLFVLLLCGLPGPLTPRPHPSRPRPRVRLLRAALAALLLAVVTRAQDARASGGGVLRATFFAVGQGDSALLQFPGGAAVLIDAGGDLRGLPAPLGAGLRDPGAREVLPALAALGVSRLDLVVLTHPHPDHAGGLPSVLRALPVGALWMTSEPGPGDVGGKIRRLAAERGIAVHEPAPGERFTSGDAALEVLAPDPRWSPERSTNDNSLVLRIDHGAVSLLLAGDAEALEESALAHGPRRLRAHLLKAGHHGSRTSTTDAFLRAVSPEVVVFSAGLQNPFGFPHVEVVARAAALGARVLTTERAAVQAESDGKALRVWPYPGG